MNKSLMKFEQENESQKIKGLNFDQHLRLAQDEIKKIKQEDLKKNYEQISKVFEIKFDGQHQAQNLQKIMPELNAIISFKNEQEQKQIFEKDHRGDKKPLKIVKKKYVGSLFYTLYRDLRSNSSFPKIIPINTILVAKSYHQFLWPAIIEDVQHVKTDNYGRFVYKVNFIDSQKSYSLIKNSMIEFTSQNIEKIKKFFGSKKLEKALKIAEKMLNQQRFEKNKLSQTESLQNIIKKQFSQISLIQLQNDQKQKLLNFVIETPRLKPQQLILNNYSQTELDQEVNNHYQKKYLQKHIYWGKNYKEPLSRQKSIRIPYKDKINFIKNKSERQGSHLQKYFEQKQQIKIQKQLINGASVYIYQYRRSLKNSKPNQNYNSTIKNILHFFSLPLTYFTTRHFPRYSYIIDFLVLLCTQDYLNLKDQDKWFIKMSKKVLKILYVTLKDYEGTNEFMNGLKMLQLCKLKDFEEISKKTIEINQ